MWGRDHQLSYQLLTTDEWSLFRAHALDYRAPLPWRHIVSIGGTYVRVNPTFLDGYFTQKGESINADVKYLAPFSKGKWQGELSASVSFKETNNNLEFSGTPVLGEKRDMITGVIAAAAMRDDARGRWILSSSLTGSPGSFNSRSSRSAYNESRFGANPSFLYSQFSAHRLTRLTPALTSTLRASVQWSSTNLLPSEQFSIGGLATVRGYEERMLSGDHGYLATHTSAQMPSSRSRSAWRLWTCGRALLGLWPTIMKFPMLRHRNRAISRALASERAHALQQPFRLRRCRPPTRGGRDPGPRTTACT